MKLLAITNIYPPQELGGYGRCIYDFVNSLTDLSHHVDVLTSDAPYLLPDDQTANTQNELIDSHISRVLRLKGSYQKGVSLITCPVECQAIDNINIRSIHATASCGYDGVLLGNIDLLGPEIIDPLLKLGIPVLHHVGFIHPPYDVKLQPSSPLYTLCPASHAVKKSLQNQGFRVSNHSVVYPGVMNKYFHVNESNSSASLTYSMTNHAFGNLLGTASNPVKLGYAGLIMQSKGLHTIIQSLKFMRDSNIHFHLSIAGSVFQKSYSDKIKSFLVASGLDPYVQFVGPLSRTQLARFWSMQNIGIFPSIHPEAFGIVGAEIMSSGLALLSTGVGGSCELFDNGVSGLIFTPDDSYDLFLKIKSLVLNPSLLQNLSSNARLHVSNKFDVCVSALSLESLFRSRLSNIL